jgi:hypothetical protein
MQEPDPTECAQMLTLLGSVNTESRRMSSHLLLLHQNGVEVHG